MFLCIFVVVLIVSFFWTLVILVFLLEVNN